MRNDLTPQPPSLERKGEKTEGPSLLRGGVGEGLIPLLRVRDVSIRFGRHQVLRRLSFDLFPQQTVALIGESGCGKSVTLKLIVGLLRPTEGEVLFEGRPLHMLSEQELTALRLRVGFLFQGSALFDSLS